MNLFCLSVIAVYGYNLQTMAKTIHIFTEWGYRMTNENPNDIQQLLSTFCEVKTLSNYLIVTGYVRDAGNDYIEISSKSEKMLLEKANSKVKIIINNKETGWRTYMGTVYLSTDQFMRIVDLKTLAEFEQRSYFRVNVHLESEAAKLPQQAEENPFENKELCTPIHIKDASLGGLLFQSDSQFQIGDELAICVPVSDKNLFLSAVIRREVQRNETVLYGCEFVDPPEAELNSLYKFLTQEQMNQIRMRKNK